VSAKFGQPLVCGRMLGYTDRKIDHPFNIVGHEFFEVCPP